jgi:hypothetical protein
MEWNGMESNGIEWNGIEYLGINAFQPRVCSSKRT